MKKATESNKLNWWKVTLTIVVVGGLCWLALTMLSGCAASFGKGDVDQRTIVLGREPAPTAEVLPAR